MAGTRAPFGPDSISCQREPGVIVIPSGAGTQMDDICSLAGTRSVVVASADGALLEDRTNAQIATATALDKERVMNMRNG